VLRASPESSLEHASSAAGPEAEARRIREPRVDRRLDAEMRGLSVCELFRRRPELREVIPVADVMGEGMLWKI
jgi:hypothetical protein